MLINSIIKNEVFKYLIIRYLSYGLLFVNSILLALFLGPESFGEWGILILIITYFNYLNFGIPNAVNNIISVTKHNIKYARFIINSSLGIITIIIGVFGLLFLTLYLINHNLFSDLQITRYLLPISLIVIANYYLNMFMNISRVFNQYITINLHQLLYPLLTFIIIIFYRSNISLDILIWVYAVAQLTSVLVYLYFTPVRLKLLFSTKLFKIISHKGFYLFMYNVSFYFILIGTRTIIGFHFSSEEFGLFTFSFTIASVILLVLDSVSFLIFPKIINRFSHLSDNDSLILLNKSRKLYIVSASFMTIASMVLYQVGSSFAGAYSNTSLLFAGLAFAQLIYSHSFGLPILLMAKNKERILAFISFSHMIINIILTSVFVFVLDFQIEYVIIGTIATYCSYLYVLYLFKCKIFFEDTSNIKILSELFSVRTIFPIVLTIIFIFLHLNNWLLTIPILIYAFLNIKTLGFLVSSLKGILLNSNLTRI